MADETPVPKFPVYSVPQGVPVADRQQAKPLLKILSRTLKAPRRILKARPHRKRKPNEFF